MTSHSPNLLNAVVELEEELKEVYNQYVHNKKLCTLDLVDSSAANRITPKYSYEFYRNLHIDKANTTVLVGFVDASTLNPAYKVYRFLCCITIAGQQFFFRIRSFQTFNDTADRVLLLSQFRDNLVDTWMALYPQERELFTAWGFDINKAIYPAWLDPEEYWRNYNA